MPSKKKNDSFTGRKAQFMNMAEDGIKIRSSAFRNKKAYDRKQGKKVEW